MFASFSSHELQRSAVPRVGSFRSVMDFVKPCGVDWAWAIPSAELARPSSMATKGEESHRRLSRELYNGGAYEVDRNHGLAIPRTNTGRLPCDHAF